MRSPNTWFDTLVSQTAVDRGETLPQLVRLELFVVQLRLFNDEARALLKAPVRAP